MIHFRSSGETEHWLTYEDSKFGIRMQYLDNWILKIENTAKRFNSNNTNLIPILSFYSPVKEPYPISKSYEVAMTEVFASRTNKIEKVGRISQRTFLVHCDGNGNMTFKVLDTPEERLRLIQTLMEKGLISKEEADEKKKKILDEVILLLLPDVSPCHFEALQEFDLYSVLNSH